MSDQLPENEWLYSDPPVVRGAPERIWLIVGDIDESCDFSELAEVTWCQDGQFPADIEYALAAEAQAKLDYEVGVVEAVLAIRTEERDQARAECERLRKEADAQRMLRYLAAQEVVFLSDWNGDAHIDDDGFPAVNVNDVFVGAADAETIPDDEIAIVYELYRSLHWDGVYAWVAARRKCEPMERYRTAEYMAARKAMEQKK